MNDEYAGQGGSYVVGKDGKRKLVERTQEPQAPKANDSAPPAPAGADSKPAKSKTEKE